MCAYDPRRDDIRLFWKGADDRPYGSFSALAGALKPKGERLVFAMNGGMFQEDQSPVGLHIENLQKLHDADTRGGPSNFHLKPNGVFWIGAGVAGVTETGRFLANPPAARYATQSGPMLIVDGKIHPKIRPTGTSAKIRNGVGVRETGAVVFAVSDEPVTFDAFARLFRDGLGCSNALFLDGSVSSLYAPELQSRRRTDADRADRRRGLTRQREKSVGGLRAALYFRQPLSRRNASKAFSVAAET